jgi:hypothetical protein
MGKPANQNGVCRPHDGPAAFLILGIMMIMMIKVFRRFPRLPRRDHQDLCRLVNVAAIFLADF